MMRADRQRLKQEDGRRQSVDHFDMLPMTLDQSVIGRVEMFSVTAFVQKNWVKLKVIV